jgi:type III restriction enzyme
VRLLAGYAGAAGRIQFWVRNLVRREGSSFFLQKADGRFYPDFLCQLPTRRPARPDPGRRIQGRGSLGGAPRMTA